MQRVIAPIMAAVIMGGIAAAICFEQQAISKQAKRTGSICPSDYRTLTFATQRFTASNVDVKHSLQPGYQWFRYNWFTGVHAEDMVDVQPDGSVNVVAKADQRNSQLATAAAIGKPPYFVGRAFGGGICMEAQIAFNPEAVEPKRGFPAFWSMALEHMNNRFGGAQVPGRPAGFEHFIEVDFMEAFKRPFPEYLGTLHDWYGQYRRTCPNAVFCDTERSFENNRGVFPPETDWHKWHRVGAVWRPAEKKRDGSIQLFFDGQPLAEPFTWTHGGAVPPLGSQDPNRMFSIIDKQHLVLVFGSVVTPLRVRSVRVYQRSAAQNIVSDTVR